MKVVRLSALRTGLFYPPGNIPGTRFCQSLSQPQGHSAAGRIMSMKNSNDTIGNRTPDIRTCSAVPQPTAPPRASSKENKKKKFFLYTWNHMGSGVIVGRNNNYKSSFSRHGRLCSGKIFAEPTEYKALWAWEPVWKFYSKDKYRTLSMWWTESYKKKRNKIICNEYFRSHPSKLMEHKVLSFENITYAVQKSSLNGMKLSQLPRKPTAC